jgi:hypothetical protein
MIDPSLIRQRFAAVGRGLNERTRRLFAAVEARTAGYGGIAACAQATGIAGSTIGRALKDLDDPASLSRRGTTTVRSARAPRRAKPRPAHRKPAGAFSRARGAGRESWNGVLSAVLTTADGSKGTPLKLQATYVSVGEFDDQHFEVSFDTEDPGAAFATSRRMIPTGMPGTSSSAWSSLLRRGSCSTSIGRRISGLK